MVCRKNVNWKLVSIGMLALISTEARAADSNPAIDTDRQRIEFGVRAVGNEMKGGGAGFMFHYEGARGTEVTITHMNGLPALRFSGDADIYHIGIPRAGKQWNSAEGSGHLQLEALPLTIRGQANVDIDFSDGRNRDGGSNSFLTAVTTPAALGIHGDKRLSSGSVIYGKGHVGAIGGGGVAYNQNGSKGILGVGTVLNLRGGITNGQSTYETGGEWQMLQDLVSGLGDTEVVKGYIGYSRKFNRKGETVFIRAEGQYNKFDVPKSLKASTYEPAPTKNGSSFEVGGTVGIGL